MKHSSSRRVEKGAITNDVNVDSIAGSTNHGGGHTFKRVERLSGGSDSIAGSTIHGGEDHWSSIDRIHRGRRSSQPTEYPAGSIGRNLVKRNYVRYLVERYHRFREADSSFGSGPARFSYAVLFKNVEREFKAPTYFIPEARFNELVEYLQQRVDRTILGKRNRARGIRNYASPEEFAAEQAAQ